MSRAKFGLTRSVWSLKRPSALLFVALALLSGQAQEAVTAAPAATALGSLKHFRTYLGNFGHVIGGVGLSGLGNTTTGLATGTITIQGVPDTADVAAAFLYWSSMETSSDFAAPSNGKFLGHDIVGKQIAPPNVPSCYGSGGGSGTTSHASFLHVYFSDVLRYLPTSTTTPGKVLPNTSYEVKLPDNGGGGSQSPGSSNQLLRTEGASLLIVYRDRTTRPFSAEVIYHGGQTQDSDHTLWSLSLKGFYQAAGQPGNVIFMVADGDASKTETLSFPGGGHAPVVNPFRSTAGPGWDTLPYDVTTVAGQSSVDMSVTEPTSVDCLSYVAVAANIPVTDTDSDGIVDILETSTVVNPILDPNDQPMPPLGDMGANVGTPDIFFEFAYLTAPAGLTYGILDDDPLTPAAVTTNQSHTHRPTKNALDMMAKAFKNAGITPHFDVGCNYQPQKTQLPDAACTYGPALPSSTSCGNAATWTPSCAIIPASVTYNLVDYAVAKGGKHAPEYSPWCGTGVDPNDCQFKDYPGTIGWKAGYQFYRDNVFQFDPRRLNIFHFVFSAHLLGLPKSDVSTSGLFHVPRTNSGMADLGGGDILHTTAAFGNNFTGQDAVVAGTIAHESGHNLERRHAGNTGVPNCKTNYLSVLNYVYQFGLNGPNGLAIDFSGQEMNSLDETNLSDAAGMTAISGTPTAYPRWYAPLATSFIHSGLQVTPVTKHCDGTTKLDGDPDMVRVDGTSATGPIDWLNNGNTTGTALSQDINFNGGPNLGVSPNVLSDGPFTGSNDWAPMKQYGLQQLGSRPNMGVLSLDVTLDDLDASDPGRAEPGRAEPGAGDPGRAEPGRAEPGRAEPGRAEPGAEPGVLGDLDLPTAASANGGPHSLTATLAPKVINLSWSSPLAVPEGRTVSTYFVYRVDGGIPTNATFSKRVLVGQTSSTTLPDNKVTAGKTYTYWIQAQLDNGDRTGISAYLTKTAQ